MIKKILIIFGAGLLEQTGYTLYLLAVNKYLIMMSSIILVIYFSIYLLIMNYAIKDKKHSLLLLFVYALSTGIANYITMALRIIK